MDYLIKITNLSIIHSYVYSTRIVVIYYYLSPLLLVFAREIRFHNWINAVSAGVKIISLELAEKD